MNRAATMNEELVHQFRYWLLFVGLLIAGESVLLTGIYFALNGELDFKALIVLAFLATWLSDSTLYLIGRVVPWQKLESSRIFRRKISACDSMVSGFSSRRLQWLFLSRFVYGTRSVVQILCGGTRLPYGSYLIVNLLGVTTWLALIMGFAYFAREGMKALEVKVFQAQLVVGLLIILFLLLQLWIRTYIKRPLSQRSFRPSTKQPPSGV